VQYIPALDGLRAVAISGVLFFHMGLLPGGFLGVDVFFVLSGFLITSILLHEWDGFDRIEFRSFYARRAVRILPAFLVFAVAALICGQVINKPEWDHLPWALSFTINWRLAVQDSPTWGGLFSPIWSLSIEEQFYLLWPFALVAVLKAKAGARPWIIAAAILIVALWRFHLSGYGHPMRTYNGFDTRADTLLVGCFIALWPSERLSRFAARIYLVPVAGLLIAAVVTHWDSPIVHEIGFSLAAISAGLIIAALQQPGTIVGFWLSRAPFRLIGRLSYSLYLWHMLAFSLPPYLGIHGQRPLGLLFALAMAAGSYYWIERPCLRWHSRRAAARRGDALEPSPASREPIPQPADGRQSLVEQARYRY
jgi:peptidoglycan/LPS O-acetylase OafA/YrhL